MADWAQPTLASTYADFLALLKARDTDSMTLMVTDGSNIPENSIKYLRASNLFQERISGAWVNKTLSVAGGGTGAASTGDARTNLGLGTIAVQNANNVTITGGSLSNLTTLHVPGTSDLATLRLHAELYTSAGTIQMTTGGKIVAIDSTRFNSLSGAALTGLNATQLTTGTIPDARFPATLPALSGANLTSLNASQLASGTVPDARFPATLPALSGANLTNLNASNLASGNIASTRLSTGGTWALSSLLAITSNHARIDGLGTGISSSSDADYNLSNAETFLFIDSSTANRTVNLPPANSGKLFIIFKNSVVNQILVLPNGVETILANGVGNSPYILRGYTETLSLIGLTGFGWLAFGGSGSGVIEDIFHGDVFFDNGETGDKTSTITWESGNPSTTDEIEWDFHGPYAAAGSGSADFYISGRVTAVNQITFNKVSGSGSGSAVASTHYFTAKKIRGVA